MVRRTGLVDRLLAADEPVISVVAPPGYGKTTLLAQWAERRNPRVAWVSCEETDNDPVTLWSALIKALNAIGPVDSAATQQLATNGSGIGAVPGFVAAIESIGEPVTIVLDHLEVISSKECQAAIAEFALRVPQGWQLAMASRERLPIPDARLRAERQIVEIDVADLAMTANEARALLSGAGVQLSRPDVEELVQRTEGWPVGLYLAALALKAGAPPAGFTFTGDEGVLTLSDPFELVDIAGDRPVALEIVEVDSFERGAEVERLVARLERPIPWSGGMYEFVVLQPRRSPGFVQELNLGERVECNLVGVTASDVDQGRPWGADTWRGGLAAIGTLRLAHPPYDKQRRGEPSRV